MKRPALIFDFGNVVAGFDHRRAIERLCQPRGLRADEIVARLGSVGSNPLVLDYECGRIGSEEFAQRLCARAGLEIPYSEFAAAWTEIFWPIEPVGRLVAALGRQGYTLVLGSNTNALHAQRFRSQFAETLAHFHAQVLSFEVGAAKPQAEFYLACALAARVPPADCVFIDDLPQNVAGARAAGLHAVLFQDAVALAQDLRRLGVEIGPF